MHINLASTNYCDTIITQPRQTIPYSYAQLPWRTWGSKRSVRNNRWPFFPVWLNKHPSA